MGVFMDALALCTKQKRSAEASKGMELWLEVDAAKLYPAAVASAIETAAKPASEIPQSRRSAWVRLRRVTELGWKLALVPRDQVTKQDDIDARAEALEQARLWFTRCLKEQVRKPFGLQILKADDFRL